MQLYIGNQNYSTWSLRAWLIFDNYNLNADIIKLKLFTPDFYDTLAKVTSTAKVPTLVDGDVAVWDSLAILEYVNDAYLNGAAWPTFQGNGLRGLSQSRRTQSDPRSRAGPADRRHSGQ